MLPPMRETPGFHHLHLNSVDPDAAIAFYVRHFPTSAKTSWGGLPALQCPNNVLVLFTRVATARPTSPQTALWHFAWHVTDPRADDRSDLQGGARSRSQLARARARGDVPVAVGGGGVRGRRAALVHASGRGAAGELARPPLRPHRAQRDGSRRVGREAAERGRPVSRGALQAGRHAGGNDRRPEPRSAGAGRSRLARRDGCAPFLPSDVVDDLQDPRVQAG